MVDIGPSPDPLVSGSQIDGAYLFYEPPAADPTPMRYDRAPPTGISAPACLVNRRESYETTATVVGRNRQAQEARRLPACRG